MENDPSVAIFAEPLAMPPPYRLFGGLQDSLIWPVTMFVTSVPPKDTSKAMDVKFEVVPT